MNAPMYIVLTAISPVHMMNEVAEAIRYGYKPCGGVSYCEEFGLMQAIVKEA